MTTEPSELRVFISWSGDRSKTVATALRTWLKQVTQGADYFMSEYDIEAGDRWEEVIGSELEASSFGVAVLTPEAMQSSWVFFECGALAKAMSAARVVPYLIGFPEKVPLLGPLGKFFAVQADRAGTFKLAEKINKATPHPLDGAKLLKLFDGAWSDLERTLDSIPKAATQTAKPPVDQMLAEILDAVQFTQRILLPDDMKAREMARYMVDYIEARGQRGTTRMRVWGRQGIEAEWDTPDQTQHGSKRALALAKGVSAFNAAFAAEEARLAAAAAEAERIASEAAPPASEEVRGTRANVPPPRAE